MLRNVVGIFHILNALLFKLVIKLRAMDLEIFVRYFGMQDGQSVDPNAPTSVFVLDGVVEQNPEDGKHHICHFLLFGVLV